MVNAVGLGLGLAAVVGGGVMPWWAGLFCWVALVLEPRRVGRVGAGLLVLGLVGCSGYALLSLATPRTAVACALVWLALPRQWSREAEPGAPILPLLVGLMALLGAAGQAGAVALLPALGVAAWLPAALSARSQAPSRAVWAGVLVLAGLIFLALPRWSERVEAPQTGFTEQVSLDGVAPVDDDAIIARVQLPVGALAPTRLRGAALSRFDGFRWTPAPGPERAAPDVPVAGATPVRVVMARPVPVAFTVGRPVAIVGGGPWQIASGSVLRGPASDRYVVWAVGLEASLPWAGQPATDEELSLPAEVVPSLDALLVAVGRHPGEGHLARVQRAMAGFRYERVARVDGVDVALQDFFDLGAGHCEHFASASAALLRRLGVPARVVTGFVVREREGDDWVIRARDAHAWVEAWTEAGWVSVDTTPSGAVAPSAPSATWGWSLSGLASSFSSSFAGFQWEAQGALWGALSPWLFGGLVVAGLGWAGRSWRRPGAGGVAGRRRQDAGVTQLERLFSQGMALAAERGLSVPAHCPPLSAAQRIVAEEASFQPLLVLAEGVYAARYAGQPAAELLPQSEAALKALRQALAC